MIAPTEAGTARVADDERRSIDPEALSPVQRYKLLLGGVVPRPIAWTSTVDEQGVPNLAPFSFFTVVSSSPPMVSITVEPREDGGGAPKDTLANVRATRELVINVVSTALADAMHVTSHEHAPDVDEFEVAGLTAVPSDVVVPPRVAEAPIGMECRLHEILVPGDSSVVIGRIVRFHVRPDLIDHRDRIDVARLQPLGRVGGMYAAIDRVFRLPRASTIPDSSRKER
jgi:flavin reductase (DIM6/NTAB) family NADH-FMN oxidoreductase RutF